ncbi:prepilin peptidase [Psychrobacillus psychrodurans]|uniref:prepilin peptidase n=1 Tax=Psychrobacillus psychrodurans TaxID=126157 RepID=UPI0008E329BC|nr:A24 family peptidase [Psychrobacillus psychrodurans]MCZ8542134.1 prepilin peptidase [Psychrobacillus psychrodurans]SFN17527.1 leader peptidase (prepilin peptidase) / N-methyltransferase [Psychrobacillus psychrodurans]
MTIIYMFLFFLYGLIFGSFFNVVGLRIPKKESIVRPSSHCTVCDRRLTIKDLVPVFSYVFLKGKCRGCGTKIHWVYPVMELVTGLLFAFAYYQLGFTLELAVALLFISLLVIITVSDIAYMLIPDKILIFFLTPLIVLRVFVPLSPWWDSIIGAFVGFGVLFLIAVVSKGGMGGGDIKLFFVIGLVLGWIPTLLTLFLASIIGTVVGIISLRRTKQGRKTPIPFGPSIAIAAIISYFYGEMLVDWYVNLFF